MCESNLDWRSDCLFTLAAIGDVNLFDYWLDKKKLNIDAQDENGDTPLHHAARGGHVNLVIDLLKRSAVMSENKKKRTALQEAYTFNQLKVAREITQFVAQRNSVNNILQSQNFNKIDIQEQQQLKQLINDFVRYVRKVYLDRTIFVRFPAKHIGRAKALIVAARCCSSINEVKRLLNNQLNLFKSTCTLPLSKEIIDERWSEIIKNKPLNVNTSLFYKTINTFVIERFSVAERTSQNSVNSVL